VSLFDSIKSIFAGGKRVDVAARFEKQREAISGTMSRFYKARDRQTGEIVGLKILDREKTEYFESRFTGLSKPSEGEIAMQLQHPNIVTTLEHGTTTDDEPYLVMEFVEGQGMNSLITAVSEELEGHRIPLLLDAAKALAAVHDAGYIHRDVCPRNLMVSPDFKSLKLIDFGLAVPATARFLLPGNRTGTPNYMAPELVRRYRTDKRLDVFAFGVTAYEICTFQLPWPSGTTGQAALAHDSPPESIETHRPQIHPSLAAAIMDCLHADPGARLPGLDHFIYRIRELGREDA
jgi:serine/threonine protein kinase